MRLRKIGLVLLILFLASCTVQTSSKYKNAIASWYGSKYHGRKTASGEKYKMHKLTAAHKKLPFGTKVEIINPENNKRVVVKITDRGPFVTGREFDLSKKAFRKISTLDKGIVKVKYRIIN